MIIKFLASLITSYNPYISASLHGPELSRSTMTTAAYMQNGGALLGMEMPHGRTAFVQALVKQLQVAG